MTNEEILNLCKENDIELYFSYNPSRNGINIKISRGLYSVSNFITRDIFLCSSDVKFYSSAIIRNMLLSLKDLEEEYPHG